MKQVLFFGAGLVPVDDANQIPVVLIELKLELALFVDDQLGSRVKNARALVFVGIVQVEFAGRQVVGGGSGVVTSFGESDRAVGGKANFAARVGADQPNMARLLSSCAGMIQPWGQLSGPRQPRGELCGGKDIGVCSRPWPRHRFQRSQSGGVWPVKTDVEQKAQLDELLRPVMAQVFNHSR